MRAIATVIKKELKSYFYSPLAYVLIGLFLWIMGAIFSKFVQIYLKYNMMQRWGGAQGVTLDKLANYLNQNMAFILCFITPFLTMRLFAEEKRQQTLELLFTSPIRGADLVIGKFLSAFILMLVMAALSSVYVLFMVLWGNPELSVIGSTYLGLVLALGCYVAVGTMISATTSSQAIAAIFTFVILILLWLLQSFAQGVTAQTDLGLFTIEWGTLLTYISPLGHFNSFSEGLIQVKDIIYFVSFTVFVLFLTNRVVESHRWR